MIRLFIDAGHGGVDPGATARYGDHTYQEKNLAWDLATRIRRLAATPEFADKLEVRVVEKKAETQSPNPRRFVNRVAQARDWQATHFVSIHWNAGPSPQGRGTEAWYKTGDQRGHRWGHDLAQDVAKQMKTQMRGAFGDRSNDNHAYLGILQNHSPVTFACLLEVGFITNEGNLRAYLDAPEHMARAIIESTLRFRTSV